MKYSLFILFIALLLIITTGCSSQNISPEAEQASIVSIKTKGSDTIVNLALAWAEKYQSENPNVNISVTGGGSGTGITALIGGTIDLANASRQIKPEEIAEAEKNGFVPVENIIARDAIAVIVNPANPVSELSLKQISSIFKGEIVNWSELGGDDRPIVCLSRETNSGTHVYFLEEVIRLGDSEDASIFAPSTLLLPSSEGIISEVRENPNAIGYDGLGYVTDEVKMIAIAKDNRGEFVLPTVYTVNDNTYPISRDLYIYSKEASPDYVNQYLRWIKSAAAQDIVLELGFVPILSGE